MMKRLLKISSLFVALGLSIIACSKEEISVDSSRDLSSKTPALVSPKVVVHRGEKTLSFKSEEELRIWFNQLAPLSDAEAEAKVRVLGLKSYNATYSDLEKGIGLIVASLEKGDNKAFSRYETLRLTARKYALFSDDSSDLYPLPKYRSLAESNTANSQGIYLVQGQERHIELYDSYEAYVSKVNRSIVLVDLPMEEDLRANNAFIRTSNRKCRLEIHLDPMNYSVHLRFSAQKKTFLWWSRFDTNFAARLRINYQSHPFKVYEAKNGFRSVMCLTNGGLNEIKAPFTLPSIYEGEHRVNVEAGTFDVRVIPFGQFVLESDSEDPIFNTNITMKGRIEVWGADVAYIHAATSDLDVAFKL